MKVSNEIAVYEIDGVAVVGDPPSMKLESHWCYDDRVVLKVEPDVVVTVLAADLRRAIQNATNHRGIVGPRFIRVLLLARPRPNQ